jgi:outer membrane protein assembly factor BamB
VELERLVTFANAGGAVVSLNETAADWPMFRANRACTVTTETTLPAKARQLWESSSPAAFTPTPPIAVGDLVFLGGSDGIVRALNARTGKLAWKAYTGGDIRYPPPIWKDRAFVGSGDGHVYAFEAKSGKPLWRFRAAPVERRIPVYGELQSTWPVASGVLVENGVAYAAAGIVNYDGTHVYALDAATGRLKWQNNTSGHLDAEAHTGVSVQGHMMVSDGKLYLAGGNAVSPAIYDIRDGTCLNDLPALKKTVQNNVIGSFAPRGSELYRIGDAMLVSGKPLYSHPKYGVYDPSVLNKTLLATAGDRTVAWVNNSNLLCFAATDAKLEERFLAAWGKPQIPDLKPLWKVSCKDSVALALGRNAVVVAQASELSAFDLQDGRQLWTQTLPAAPVPWGLCVNRDGRIIVTLENGKVVCINALELAALP